MFKEHNTKEVSALASDIINLAKDRIAMKYRFFDAAVYRIETKAVADIKRIMFEKDVILYDPYFIIKQYKNENNYVIRMYLHMLMHLIFLHCFVPEKLDKKMWDLASDIVAESIVLDFDDGNNSLNKDIEALDEIAEIRSKSQYMTVDGVYKYFRDNPPDTNKLRLYERLFCYDSHEKWVIASSEKNDNKLKQKWQDITRKVKTEMTQFSKTKVFSESIKDNFDEAFRKKYSYKDVLKRFIDFKEESKLSQDEFDYIYYTHGLDIYGNVPLVEPLEYRENKKVNDLAIIVDTSASCKGEIIKSFIEVTYGIISESDSIFDKTNIHIIQCDSKVQSDYVIRKPEDIERFINEEKIIGYGGTDFRPAFSYVDKLIRANEFTNLKGVIYFTDGYGVYPSKMPGYDVIFAFLDVDKNRPKVPGWALEVVVKEDLTF